MKTIVFFCHIFLLFTLSLAAHADESVCKVCHADKTAGDVHSSVTSTCQDCHGDGEQHIAQPSAGGVIKFRDEDAKTRTNACKGCHSDSHTAGINAHKRAGIACNDCHAIHEQPAAESALVTSVELEQIGDGSRPCIDCHREVFAEFGFSERHRLQEGTLSCSSCHDPHGPKTQSSLSNAKNDVCTNCHAAQDGPYVFEHDVSRVDGCMACHDAHGSPIRHLLAHQKGGDLCYSCHAEVPQFHLGFAPVGSPRFGADTACTNCHVTIHGSNLDENFLK